jgi:hypothetical protein
MYVLLECLTVLALVALVAVLLFAVIAVLVALSHGIMAMRRMAPNAAEPAITQEPRMSLAPQRTILTSTELPVR